jgi:transcriptional regulator with XRE-family HTH domain
VIIGERLRALREQKKFSQGEVEKRTGFLRCYISRVEYGHTVPAVETLEKFARALEVPIYQLFYDGENPPKLPNPPQGKTGDDMAWASSGKNARWVAKFRRLLARAEESDRKLLMFMAEKMAKAKPDCRTGLLIFPDTDRHSYSAVHQEIDTQDLAHLFHGRAPGRIKIANHT